MAEAKSSKFSGSTQQQKLPPLSKKNTSQGNTKVSKPSVPVAIYHDAKPNTHENKLEIIKKYKLSKQCFFSFGPI